MKPLQQPEIWASATLLSSGPKAGRPTKATSEAVAAIEGHKPGPTEPTTSNEFNVFENKVSLLCRWVFEGRFDKQADEHIVETDSSGLLSARAADFGDVTQPGPSLNVTNSSTGWAAQFFATDKEGFRVIANYTAGNEQNAVFFQTTGDGSSGKFTETISCLAAVTESFGGLRVDSSPGSIIAGEDTVSGVNSYSDGGPAMQCRTTSYTRNSAHIINLTQVGTSLRVGFGQLEPGGANLGGNAIDAEGGGGDPAGGGPDAGSGALLTGGDGAAASDRAAGWGLIAVGGQHDAAQTTQFGGGGVLALSGSDDDQVALEVRHLSNLNFQPALLVDSMKEGVGVDITSPEFGSCVIARGQQSVGIRVIMTDFTGSIAAALLLDPQSRPTLALSGDMWTEGTFSRSEFLCHPSVTVPMYFHRGLQPPCFARTVPPGGGYFLDGVHATPLVLETFSWGPANEPIATTVVRCRITVNFIFPASTTANFTLDIFDFTGSVVLCTLRLRRDTGASSEQFTGTFSEITGLAAGARTFQFRFFNDTGVVGPTQIQILGHCEIEQIMDV